MGSVRHWPRFHVVTIFTEGAPFDDGVALAGVEREFRELVEPVADGYRAYSPRTLAGDGDEVSRLTADHREWVEQHPRRSELRNYNSGWARVGFLAWKPYVLAKELARDDLDEGDIVMYHDVDLRKYPEFREYVAHWRTLSVAILDDLETDLFAPMGLPMGVDVKAFLLERYLDATYRQVRGVWAGLIIARKSAMSAAFVDEWMRMAADPDNVSPLPNPRPYPEAAWHSGEQAVLSVLAAGWRQTGSLPSDWPRYAVRGRRFGLAELYPRRLRDGRLVGTVGTGYRVLRSNPRTAPVLDPLVRLVKRTQRRVRGA